MTCNWAWKTLKFHYQGSWISLQGVVDSAITTELQSVSLLQILKWQKGCDIWAAAMLQHSSPSLAHPLPSTQSVASTQSVLPFHLLVA